MSSHGKKTDVEMKQEQQRREWKEQSILEEDGNVF